jgi:outer membrane lipoprotein LolB
LKKHIIWILFLTLTLSSCARLKPEAAPSTPAVPKTSWAERQTALNNIHNWNLSGKIAVQSSHDAGSASVNWSQRLQNYTISLQGPLGAGAMKLSGSPGQVTLLASDGKSYHAASPEELLAKQWGFHLPVSSMKYWIRGLPVPDVSASTRFDNDGRLSSIAQQGYRIDYLAYSNHGRMELPEKLSIVSPSLRVKIVVYQWNLG